MVDSAPEGFASPRHGHAVVIGLGGLGIPAAIGLAAGGIGRLTLVDGDSVELSNLHRQPLYRLGDLGAPKARVAAERMRQLYPTVEIAVVGEQVSRTNVAETVRGADVVLDAVDDPAIKLLLNDACVRDSTPLCHAAAAGWRGQLFLVIPGQTACLRCLFTDASEFDDTPTCQRSGILGPVVGVLGALQAVEALRAIGLVAQPGIERPSRLLLFDGRSGTARQLVAERDPACMVCRNAAAGGTS